MMAAGVPAMLYHELAARPRDVYAVPPAEFDRHLGYLADAGFRVLSLEHYFAPPAGVRLPDRSVILTFDDGYASDFTFAYPRLRERGFPAAFFVTTGWVGQENRVTWPQLRALASGGMTIGSHGVTHRFLSHLPGAEAARELLDSRRHLEQQLGQPVKYLALPGGRWADWLRPLALEAGYEGVCTSRVGVNRWGRDDFLLRRFALRTRTSARFAALVEQTPAALARESLVASLKAALRHTLGTRPYETLRRHLVKG